MLPTKLDVVVLLASSLITLVAAACVPDFPDKLLSDVAVIQHQAVLAAFEEVERNLSSLYINTTRDGLSFAVVSINLLCVGFSNHR